MFILTEGSVRAIREITRTLMLTLEISTAQSTQRRRGKTDMRRQKLVGTICNVVILSLYKPDRDIPQVEISLNDKYCLVGFMIRLDRVTQPENLILQTDCYL